jgi:peptidoglycan/LPS O-acetylase OafA/YrhL
VVFGALLLPYITAASVDMYLVLSPTWSLFNELVINVLYSAVAKVLSNRFLVICCASAAMILFPATLLNGSIEFGPYRGTLLMGLVRTIFSFSYGVLIYRFRSKRVMEHGLLPLSMILATTIALFAVGDVGGLNGLYDALAVTLVIPAVIAVTAHVRISGLFAKAAALLGDLSYPVYILHWPLRLALFATGMQTRLPEAVFLSASAVIICLFAWVVTRLYDEPARKLLQRKLVRGATLPTHPVTVP